jgi:hypothetical protein
MIDRAALLSVIAGPPRSGAIQVSIRATDAGLDRRVFARR